MKTDDQTLAAAMLGTAVVLLSQMAPLAPLQPYTALHTSAVALTASLPLNLWNFAGSSGLSETQDEKGAMILFGLGVITFALGMTAFVAHLFQPLAALIFGVFILGAYLVDRRP